MEILTNVCFEEGKTHTLDDVHLFAFAKYINALYLLADQFFHRYVRDKFFKVQKAFPPVYYDLFFEKKITIKILKKKIIKKKTLNTLLFYLNHDYHMKF